MAVSTATRPLTHRLIDRYMMFGLAGLFAFLCLAVGLAWRQSLLEFIALTAVVPILVLLVGAFVLRRTVRLSEAIEQQLHQLAAVSSSFDMALHPLAEAGPTAEGWNMILAHVRDNRTLTSLESRLGNSLAPLAERRWEALANHLGDGVAVCDAEHSILLANNALAAIFGIDESAELTGRTMGDLLADSVAAESGGELEKLSVGTGELICDLKRGPQLVDGVLRVSRKPVSRDAFPKGATLWTLRDVTQQKMAEETRSQFVCTATHELRTPLANIKAYAETLAEQDGIDLEKQKGFYNIINTEATRLARFVDELLNVSQMEAGSIMISRHEVDIERLLHEVAENVQPQVEQKQLRFETHLPPKLPKLKADKGTLAAALVNLLSNGVKYTPDEGSVKLTVEVEGAEIHFHVEDSGIGIAADELPRLCEKFFRSADQRVRSITGSGLGLAYTQEVARLHGGKLTVKSELNKGSRFTMSLPLQ